MPPGFVASCLTISADVRRDGLAVNYVVDARAPATLWLPVASVSGGAADLVVAAAALYLGSLSLAKEIRVESPMDGRVLEDLVEIAESLYDIRRWRDQLTLDGPPILTVERPRESVRSAIQLTDRRSVALWSGGKDSTLALMALAANDYETHPVHFTVNAGAEEEEQRAIEQLEPLLGIEYTERVVVKHPDFLDFSNAYAAAWDAFPLSNRVPFGRDLLLAALAVPVALRVGASVISLGHDRECRTAMVDYHGRLIPRNDMESIEVSTSFEGVIQRHVHSQLRMLPPLANITELRVLRDLFVSYPEVMRRTSFCFWGRNCGRCGKCLRYFLADRLYRPGLLTFEVNPLTAGACPELAELLDEPDVLFQKEVMVLLGRLAERGDIGHDEVEFERFKATRLADVLPHLDRWEYELLSEAPDPQVPQDFRPLAPSAVSL